MALLIAGAQEAIPEKIGDAVIAPLIMVMMYQVQPFYMSQQTIFWRVAKMLNTVTEFIKKGR